MMPGGVGQRRRGKGKERIEKQVAAAVAGQLLTSFVIFTQKLKLKPGVWL
jgi:hypothetical protein